MNERRLSTKKTLQDGRSQRDLTGPANLRRRRRRLLAALESGVNLDRRSTSDLGRNKTNPAVFVRHNEKRRKAA